MRRLAANRALLGEWAAAHPSGLRCALPEATYLSWIDFAGTPIAAGPAAVILERGRVMLNAGADFSRHTDVATTTFARLNFATDEVVLAGLLAGIDRAVAGGV
jgi:cystathionine beta-lyase